MKFTVATEIDRPIGDVWAWYAVDHVQNHPRWDPDMELRQITPGPVGLGTRIHRRNRHFDEPIDGEMEVVEWDAERTMGVRIRDANLDTHGRVTFEALESGGTRLTIEADFPGMDDAAPDRIRPLMERTARNIRRLVELDGGGVPTALHRARPSDTERAQMSKRTHHVTTNDGVTIRGTVHGQGPPLVFWHGAYGDGDLDWTALLPHLTGRFTCYLPSWRGRGLSGEHPDLSYGRRVDDVRAYVDSIGEPTGLVSWSGGANPALAAAAQSDAVTGVAPFEPTIGSVMDEQERAAFRDAVGRMRELASEGRLTEALRAAASFPFNDEELAVAEDAGYFEAAGRYVPNLLNVFRQLMEHKGPTADDPAVLGAISAPVLALHGAVAKPFWIRSARYVAEHVPNGQVQQIPEAGHAAPLTHPEALAEALAEFFAPGRDSASAL